MSRRGPNQENPERRHEDVSSVLLKHRWLKVLEIKVGEEFVVAPENAFVRAETIAFTHKAPPRKVSIDVRSGELGALEAPDHDELKKVSSEIEKIHEAWVRDAGTRRRSMDLVNNEITDQPTQENGLNEEQEKWIGDALMSSGWNWDNVEEGVNVSGDMIDKAMHEYTRLTQQQVVLSARYSDANLLGSIGHMVLEVWNDVAEELPYMRIRWLIGHPDYGGAGSALVDEAKRRFFAAEQYRKLRVDSAFAAVGWYEKMGFTKEFPGKNVTEERVGYADTELVIEKPGPAPAIQPSDGAASASSALSSTAGTPSGHAPGKESEDYVS